MTNETLEKKSKESLWDTIVNSVKIAVPVSLLVCPLITNVESYFFTKHVINDRKTSETKEITAEMYKNFYKKGNFIKKTCFFGEYLAANQYLQNKQ